MNREIKFRAWSGKKMILPEYADKEDFHLLADGTIVETHEYGYERHELTSRRSNDWHIMQYTGLKDKNGKEIYEGDIIDCCAVQRETHNVIEKGDPVEVKYYDGYFYPFGYNAGWRSGVDDIEVIGNVYENPELLTANKPL